MFRTTAAAAAAQNTDGPELSSMRHENVIINIFDTVNNTRINDRRTI